MANADDHHNYDGDAHSAGREDPVELEEDGELCEGHTGEVEDGASI